MTGTPGVDVAKRFHLSISALYRHTRSHVEGLAPGVRPTVAGLSSVEAKRLRLAADVPAEQPVAATHSAAPSVMESVSLRSPDDVLSALEWSVAETRSLLQRAKIAGNLELQNRLLQTAIAALDKLAKASGIYSDGTIVNVNLSERRMERAVAKLTDEQLEAGLAALARGEQVAIEGEVLG
jgi:hypothetical protein